MARKFQSSRSRRAARKAGFGVSPRLGAAAFGALVVAFFVGYLVQVNATSSKGFQIRTLQSKISDLKEQGDKLELKVAQEQAVASVEQKVQAMGMVPAQQVDYVSAQQPGVAMR